MKTTSASSAVYATPPIAEQHQSKLLGVRRWGILLVAAPSLIVLAMHAYLGTYSRFMADDYCSAAEANRLGVLRAAWYWYLNWNGRYSANVLDALFGVFGPGITPAVTAGVLIVWLAALSALILLMTRSRTGSGSSALSVAIAAAILFLTLALAPDVAQAVYWGQGMRSIVPPIIVMTLYIGLFLWLMQRPWSPRFKWVYFGLSAMLAFGAGGFSETYTALQLGCLALALVAGLLFGKGSLRQNDLWFLFAGLLGAAAAFVAVVASPGNAFRAAYYPAPPPLVPLLGIALHNYMLFLQNALGTGPRILGIMAILALGVWVGASLDLRISGWRVLAAILLLGAVLTFACFPPAAYGESEAPPDRTLLIPTLLLVVTLFVFGVAIGSRIAPRWRASPLISGAAIVLIMLAAAVSFFQLSSLQPEFAAYAKAWDQFHGQMLGLRQAGAPSAEISTATMNANNWARLNVLGDNPKFWVNRCISDYYGVPVISKSP